MNVGSGEVIENRVSKDAVKWNTHDTTWTFGLFGTAIGAGVLFFPIRAGFGGLIPILIMLVLAYPIAFLCHRALARFCLTGKHTTSDITQTVETYFGKTGGIVITFLYFFAICPLLWIYGVTMTNTFMDFWQTQLGYAPLNRGIVALMSLILLSVIIFFGKNIMVKVMSYLVFPFIICLMLISVLLIPFWKSDVLSTFTVSNLSLMGESGLFVTVWLGIGVMVFAFNFSPIVSSFVVSQREEYEARGGKELVENKCNQIISKASMLMVFVVMFFAFSCLFTLSPDEMAEAKAANITILSYLASYVTIAGGSHTLAMFLEYAAPLIALVAVFKSFFGHYLGTLEGLNGLIVRFAFCSDRNAISTTSLNVISMTLIMGSTWYVAYENPNVLDMIERMGSPIIACLLCLLPMYAVNKLPIMAKYKGQISNYFVTIIGTLTILNMIYKFL